MQIRTPKKHTKPISTAESTIFSKSNFSRFLCCYFIVIVLMRIGLSLYLSSYLTVFARARTAAQLVCIWTSEWITMWLLMSPTLTSQKNEELKTNWMDIVGSQFKCVWVSVFERVLLASYHSKCNGSESLCTLQCKLTVSLSLWL